MKRVLAMLLALAAVGCSTVPRQGEQVAPPPTPAVRVAATTAAPAKTAALDPRVNADLLKQGYRYKLGGDEVLYCRQQAQTGTRFTSNLCLTEQQIKDNQQHARDELGRVRAGPCLPPACN